uniref:Uncharacterized protein n=1 Tax=Romanomermis culicivorax TaxID=13658 RepID=A0A915JGN3_ROMCU
MLSDEAKSLPISQAYLFLGIQASSSDLTSVKGTFGHSVLMLLTSDYLKMKKFASSDLTQGQLPHLAIQDKSGTRGQDLRPEKYR